MSVQDRNSNDVEGALIEFHWTDELSKTRPPLSVATPPTSSTRYGLAMVQVFTTRIVPIGTAWRNRADDVSVEGRVARLDVTCQGTHIDALMMMKVGFTRTVGDCVLEVVDIEAPAPVSNRTVRVNAKGLPESG
jgi:hypothetical protein